MTLYFAFGSNMDIAQMIARCPSSRVIGPGELRGHELAFPHYSQKRQCAVAGYQPASGCSVWGVVYDASGADLAHLDTFEGFDPHRDRALNKYNRVQINVSCSGKMLNCMTYQATPHPAPGLTSRHYLGQLISGARQHGLPADYVAFLERFPTLD
jgi:gamma-glutamylcyclotransferase